MACLHECRLLLISFHDNNLFSFTELGNIVVMFMLPWVDQKFTVKFTMSNVNGCIIYMRIGCVVHPVQPNHFHALPSPARTATAGMLPSPVVVLLPRSVGVCVGTCTSDSLKKEPQIESGAAHFQS